MVHPVKLGRTERMSYSRLRDYEIPDLVEIQKKSYQWFLDEGFNEVLHDISPIESKGSETLTLSFLDKEFDSASPQYTIEECKIRDTNYSAPLRVKVRLEKPDGSHLDQMIYIGEFPIMTPNGTFIINGAERVIISQLVRSPGCYFNVTQDPRTDKPLYGAQVIPNRGAWLEYESDANDVLSVRIDRLRKFPITVFLRSLGFGTNEEILTRFGEDERLLATLAKDSCRTREEGLLELYRKVRPGEPVSVEAAENYLRMMFFDPRRYDLARVGIFKVNKKLSLAERITRHKAAETVVSPEGEVLLQEGDIISPEAARRVQQAGVSDVLIYPMLVVGETVSQSLETHRVIGNERVDALPFLTDIYGEEALEGLNLAACGIREQVRYSLLRQLAAEVNALRGDDPSLELVPLLTQELERRADELCPKHLVAEDIIASISYLLGLFKGVGQTDDIDHLGNRRIRSVGELLQNQVRVGFARMEKTVRERMAVVQNIDTVTPQQLVNARAISAAFKEFFGSSQLSQFMDQQNPLAELTHKRRLSALGPGGLSRDRANFEVRDVHTSHYGRMCPIETPEGPNIGLINALATYARINIYGFIETPYRRVNRDRAGHRHRRVPDRRPGRQLLHRAGQRAAR